MEIILIILGGPVQSPGSFKTEAEGSGAENVMWWGKQGVRGSNPYMKRLEWCAWRWRKRPSAKANAGDHKMLKREGNGFSLRASRRHTALLTLDFSPVRPISDFWPPKLWNNKVMPFDTTEFVICYNSNRKLIQHLRHTWQEEGLSMFASYLD